MGKLKRKQLERKGKAVGQLLKGALTRSNSRSRSAPALGNTVGGEICVSSQNSLDDDEHEESGAMTWADFLREPASSAQGSSSSLIRRQSSSVMLDPEDLASANATFNNGVSDEDDELSSGEEDDSGAMQQRSGSAVAPARLSNDLSMASCGSETSAGPPLLPHLTEPLSSPGRDSNKKLPAEMAQTQLEPLSRTAEPSPPLPSPSTPPLEAPMQLFHDSWQRNTPQEAASSSQALFRSSSDGSGTAKGSSSSSSSRRAALEAVLLMKAQPADADDAALQRLASLPPPSTASTFARGNSVGAHAAMGRAVTFPHGGKAPSRKGLERIDDPGASTQALEESTRVKAPDDSASAMEASTTSAGPAPAVMIATVAVATLPLREAVGVPEDSTTVEEAAAARQVQQATPLRPTVGAKKLQATEAAAALLPGSQLLRAHVLIWGFRLSEAEACLQPLRVAAASTTEGEPGASGLAMWLSVLDVESSFLRALLSANEAVALQTVARVGVASEQLRAFLPRGAMRARVQEQATSWLLGKPPATKNNNGSPTDAAAALAAGDAQLPSLAAQAVILDLELCIVSAAAHMMAGQLMKAAAAIRKLIKQGSWVLKAADRMSLSQSGAASGGAHSADSSPARGRKSAAVATAALQGLWRATANGRTQRNSASASAASSPPNSTANSPGRFWSRVSSLVESELGLSLFPAEDAALAASWFGKGAADGGSFSSCSSGGGVSDAALAGAIPALWAASSWKGYGTHVLFLAGCMHVGTSLLPKQLTAVLGHYLGYVPSLDRGARFLVSATGQHGVRRPAAATILQLLTFREAKRVKRANSSSSGKGPSPGLKQAGALQKRCDSPPLGESKGGGAQQPPPREERDSVVSDAMTEAAAALEAFYASFPMAPLISYLRAKSCQFKGRLHEAEMLCDVALRTVTSNLQLLCPQAAITTPRSLAGSLQPEAHILALQLGHARFFQRQWSESLDLFTKVVSAVESNNGDSDTRGIGPLAAAFAAAAACGQLPGDRAVAHSRLQRCCERLRASEGTDAKDNPVLRTRVASYVMRGEIGCELWLVEFLYLHNASTANEMAPAWHAAILELLSRLPLSAHAAAASTALATPLSALGGGGGPPARTAAAKADVELADMWDVATTETDAALALLFFRALVLYKMERNQEALDCLRPIVCGVRDADETEADARWAVAGMVQRKRAQSFPSPGAPAEGLRKSGSGLARPPAKGGSPKSSCPGPESCNGCAGCVRMLQLRHSRFVLPHALYLTALLSYRARPSHDTLAASLELCKRAKKYRNYDFDARAKIQWLQDGLNAFLP